MANRNKPLSAQALTKERAVAALTRHLGWQKWPLARQLDYLFAPGAAEEIAANLEPHTALAQLHLHCVAHKTVAERTRTRALLQVLATRCPALLRRPDVAPALGALGENYHYRVRELLDWQPKTKNAHAQLESLVRHLFDQYGDVPAWLIGAWTATRTANLGLSLVRLTIHVGRGQSLRSFPGLYFGLTRRLEHEMRQAPAACTILEALRYAQLAVRGAPDWFGIVLASRLGRAAAADDEFWLGVVDFFRADPLADPRQFGPVCDWIYQKRHVGMGPEEPAQPGFSLRGRRLASVLAHTAAWHRRLARLRHHAGSGLPLATSWPGLPVPDFVGGEAGRVRIRQLTTFGELVEEGRVLQHCVASYVAACRRGRCGIFALTLDHRPAVTLEVAPDRTVVQARGRHNRPMTADEREWVRHWLQATRLAISKYV